jgi:hypothetical protein
MARDEEIIIILVGNKRGEDKGIEKNAWNNKKGGTFKADWSQDLQWLTVMGSYNGRQNFSMTTKWVNNAKLGTSGMLPSHRINSSIAFQPWRTSSSYFTSQTTSQTTSQAISQDQVSPIRNFLKNRTRNDRFLSVGHARYLLLPTVAYS